MSSSYDRCIKGSDDRYIISFAEETSPTGLGFMMGSDSHPTIPIPGLYYFPGPVLDSATYNLAMRTYSGSTASSKAVEWETVGKGATSRKVVHYGYKYNYATKKTNEPAAAMPSMIRNMRSIVKANIAEFTPPGLGGEFPLNQCIVNAYEPGQGINAHTDHFDYDDFVCCFTLGSGATMVFTNSAGKTVELWANPNSLYVMSGDARYKWTHALPQRKSDVVGGTNEVGRPSDGTRVPRGKRISITFRSLKPKN